MRNSIALVFLAIFAANAQHYLVEVELFNAETFTSTVRCAGALFNDSSVVIPASCIHGLDSSQLRVRMTRPLNSSVISNALSITGSDVYENFHISNLDRNNIGVVTHDLRRPEFEPRNLTRIPIGSEDNTSIFCVVHGLLVRPPRILQNFFDDPVTVFSPRRCNIDDPHTYCAVFDFISHPTCEMGFGSPLTCDGKTVAGFVLNRNGCVRRNFTDASGNTREMAMLHFTSMSLFHQWNSSASVGCSVLLIALLAAFGVLRNF